MEEKNSIGIKDMVQLGGIILMGLTVFLGLNYSYGPVYAVPTALVIIIAAYGAVYILVKLKKSETNQEQKQTIELLILIFGYGTIALISGLFILHFLTVETKLKNEIKHITSNSIEEFDVISNDYNKFVENVNISLNTKIETAYIEKKSRSNSTVWDELNLTGGTTDTEEKNTKETHRSLLNDLIKGYDYDNLQNEANKNKSQAKVSVEKWDYFSIVEKLEKIDFDKAKYMNGLIELSQKQQYDKGIIFSPEIKTTVQAKLFELRDWSRFSKDTAWGISIIAIFIINGSILFPYLFSKRSGRRGPSGKDGSKDAGFTWSSK